MRLHALALLGFFAASGMSTAFAADGGWSIVRADSGPLLYQLGAGETPDTVSVRAATDSYGRPFRAHRLLARSFDAGAWRGKRVRVTLHLKNESGPITSASVQVTRSGTPLFRTEAQSIRSDGAWQTQSFVVDVAHNATMLALQLDLRGAGTGTGLVDNVHLEAVGDLPVSPPARPRAERDYWYDTLKPIQPEPRPRPQSAPWDTQYS